jgi:glycosyltransferase involved in cell wall biosynthesis
MAIAEEERSAGRPANVMVLIPSLDIGGAEMDMVRNLPRIDRTRFKITVCAFLAHGPLAAPLRATGIEIIGPIRLRMRKPRFLHRLSWLKPRGLVGRALKILAGAFDYLRIAAAVATHMRQREIDVVHAILPNSYLVATIACMLARRPALIMSRVSLNWYQDWIVGSLERHILHRLVDLAICNSSAIRQDLLAEGIPAAKIRLIPNGIDLAELARLGIDREQARDRLGISRDAFVVTLVANFYPHKGHADLLQALQLVGDQLPSGWVLLAVGRDVRGNLERMQRLSHQLGLSTHVRFLGQRNDVAVILRAADIHVSASHTEGFPNNVLEAMGTSVPVVATSVGGVPEMVVDGETGILVPARAPGDMARALRQLASDPERRRSMGEAGRARVARSFSIELSVQALQDSYAALAAAVARSPRKA